MTIDEARVKIKSILDDVDCDSDIYEKEIKPVEDALKIKESIENEYAKTHILGFCKVPKNIDDLPILSASNSKYVAPVEYDCRGLCTKTENQGSLPYCAAYSCTNWAENQLWKLSDIPPEIDPAKVYKYAKTIDGDPYGEGTTLTAVLQYLLDKGIFDKKQCAIKVIRKNANSINSVKYALHKFGSILGAFNCTSEWYSINKNKTCISGNGSYRICGGHAVELCGYTKRCIIIHNSWGTDWGVDGFSFMTWEEFEREWLYGAVLSGCLNGLTLNV